MTASTQVPHQGRANCYDHFDSQLAQILASLAHLLLKHGYGHSRLSRLMKAAFVDAARSIGPKLNSKANIARIAALTGLTRVDVSRVLKSGGSVPVEDDQLNRATRVAIGWRTDRLYLDKRKNPRRLPISSTGIGFNHLVRKYSGDIPVRAMLAEMLRLGLVSQSNSGLVTLKRDTPALPPHAVAAIDAIAPWVSLVADTGRSLASSSMTSEAQQVKLHFISMSEVIAATRELRSRQRSFVAGIQQLGTRRQQTGAYEVTVSVAVATTRPTRSNLNKK